MWNNRERHMSELDAWMPESKTAESRVPGQINADYMDERLMRFRSREFPSFPGNDREHSYFAGQGREPRRDFGMSRESQRQAMPSKKLSKSANSRQHYMDGLDFERGSTHPRRVSYMSREEDLYASQEIVAIDQNSHQAEIDQHMQRVAHHVGEELYPSMTPTMNCNSATYHSQGYSANISKTMNSPRAPLEGAMTKYASDHSNSQSQDLQYENKFMGVLDYRNRHFAGPYDYPYSRFQGHNRHVSGGSYSVELSLRDDGAYSHPAGPPRASQRDMSNVSALNRCTCCQEHGHMQLPRPPPSSFRPHADVHAVSHYPSPGYQQGQNHAHFHNHSVYGRISSSSSLSSLRKLHAQRKAADPQFQVRSAVSARKENCPPLPGVNAPPYVLCQGCGKVTQFPAELHVEGAVVKLRCGACRRISKFCNIVHPCYHTLFKEGSATSSMQKARSAHSPYQHEMLSAEEVNGSPNTQGPMSERLIEDFGSSCVVGGHSGKEEKQRLAESNGILNSVRRFEAFTPGMLLEQAPGEDEWRGGGTLKPWSVSGTIHEDSSSLFSASGSLSTRNTGGVKSFESQQLDTPLNFDSHGPMSEEGVEGKDIVVATDCTHEQSDAMLRLHPEELHGLISEGGEESSLDDFKDEAKASIALPQKIELHHAKKHDEQVSSINENDQKSTSLAPKERTDPTKRSEPPVLSPKFSERLLHSTSKEHIDGQNSGTVRPKVEVDNDGSSSAPAPGHGNHKNTSVVVNGMIIPSDALKSAERVAGPIRPGVYWYDYQAGFWGVMGGPCLGIIPPFIEEFKRSLAKDCAGGRTGVMVNGRELHKKDLDALAGRGLPRTPSKAYMVDISGQVVDGSSGQMLRSLGRLAPTVQKRGRGCGMFQPPSLS